MFMYRDMKLGYVRHIEALPSNDPEIGRKERNEQHRAKLSYIGHGALIYRLTVLAA